MRGNAFRLKIKKDSIWVPAAHPSPQKGGAGWRAGQYHCPPGNTTGKKIAPYRYPTISSSDYPKNRTLSNRNCNCLQLLRFHRSPRFRAGESGPEGGKVHGGWNKSNAVPSEHQQDFTPTRMLGSITCI